MASLTSSIGARGERAAVRWLRDNGFMILDLNWRSGHYELDIVAERWGIVHFVEVKSRSINSLTTPEEAITPKKFASLAKAARLYVATHKLPQEFQFDLVAVNMADDGTLSIDLIEQAMEFQW